MVVGKMTIRYGVVPTRILRQIISMVQQIKRKLRAFLSARNSKPPLKSRYDYLLALFKLHDPKSMVEIGVWRGDRAVRFLSEGKSLRCYIGFDLFEEMTDEKYVQESMGLCSPNERQQVMQRLLPVAYLNSCKIDLVAGLTEYTLRRFVNEGGKSFDFIYIDGGHSLETVANDWKFAEKMMSRNGLVVFDDYYLNDDTRGVKKLVDDLTKNPNYVVRFFPMIEDIVEDLQITMVLVRRSENLV